MALRAVMMVKNPDASNVKTRLIEPGGLDETQVRAIAWALIECSARRLAERFDLTLAISPDGACDSLRARLSDIVCVCIDQGAGHLGERLDRVWRTVAPDAPIAFFGADSPDLPDRHLKSIEAALERHDAAIGPSEDGGYWTLAARRHRPALLDAIDWGTPSVYEQTCARATAARIGLATLDAWRDVDRIADLEALRARLESERERNAADFDPHLQSLREYLNALPARLD